MLFLRRTLVLNIVIRPNPGKNVISHFGKVYDTFFPTNKNIKTCSKTQKHLVAFQ
ncbi:MAG: hypothetical protein JWQ40_1985 [Segetibacter sp.]|nr:hypothetical protein [Segetibacter sp.]